MSAPYKLLDPVTRLEDADNTEPSVMFYVGDAKTNAVQIEASAGATGSVEIAGSLQYDHDPSIEFPVVHEEAVSANSRHLIWFADMPMQTMRVDVSGLGSGTVTIRTAKVAR